MKKLIFALIAGATAMGAAQAQQAYVGVGIATADHTFNAAGASNVNTDGYKANGKLFGGYEFDQMWGVEAGYTDFRKSDSSYTLNNARGRAETDGNSFYIAGKATAPVNEQFSVFGKLGAARNKTTLTATDVSLNRSESKTEVYAGIGAQYNLSKQVALTAEYERYGKTKDFGAKADVWTVAARYNF
jgi:opacity protein-like surface antigen